MPEDDATTKALATGAAGAGREFVPERGLAALQRDRYRSARLKVLDDAELKDAHDEVHVLFGKRDKTASVEGFVNAHLAVLRELERRNVDHPSPPRDTADLDELSREVRSVAKGERQTMEIRTSGAVEGRRVRLDEVLEGIKDARLGPPVYLTGGVVNQEEGTTGDVDVVVPGWEGWEEHERWIFHFRLVRGLPEDLRHRINVMDDRGNREPFTDHVKIGDMGFLASDEFVRIEMSTDAGAAEKAAEVDPYLEYPGDPGPRRGVLHAHARGRSVHLDFRASLNADELVGWTLFAGKPGEVDAPIESMVDADAAVRGWSAADGNEFLKPLAAPSRMGAGAKQTQPPEWLDVEEVVEPGGAGATKQYPGVFVMIAGRSKRRTGLREKDMLVSWGAQKPQAHEYFLESNGDHPTGLNGILFLRQLAGRAAPKGDEEVEAGRTTAAGEMFWTAMLTRDLVPGTLERSAVRKGWMPPDGISALPESLMKAIPKEHRYWTKKGKAAREARDALVDARLVTPKTVSIRDGRFHLDLAAVEKAGLERWKWWLMRRDFKGPAAIRITPTKTDRILLLDDGQARLREFVFTRDPRGDHPQSAVERDREPKRFVELKGEIEPGTLGNDTKATPAFMALAAKGTATVEVDAKDRLRLDLGGKFGRRTLTREGPISDIWIAEPGEGERPTPEELEERSKTGDNVDAVAEWHAVGKAAFRPFIRFQPMKPRSGHGAGLFFSPAALWDGWAAKLVAKGDGAVLIQPKLNGFHLVLQKRGPKALLFTEDSPERDLAKRFPEIASAVASLPDDVVLVGELMLASKAPGAEAELAGVKMEHRTELISAAGTKAPIPETTRKRLVVVVYALLYEGDEAFLGDEETERREALEKLARSPRFRSPLILMPQREVKTKAEYLAAAKWAEGFPGSEGDVVKMASSTYTLSGATSSWAKRKKPFRVVATVLGRHPVKGSPGVWNYACGIGPVPAGDRDQYAEVVEQGGKLWARVGTTFNTTAKAADGERLAVAGSEFFADETPAGTIRFRWFIPIVEGKVDEEATTIAGARRLARLAETDAAKADEPDEFIVEVQKAWLGTGEDGERDVLFMVTHIPFHVDGQGDWMSERDVLKACHRFAVNGLKLNLEHNRIPGKRLKEGEAVVVENKTADVAFIVDAKGEERPFVPPETFGTAGVPDAMKRFTEWDEGAGEQIIPKTSWIVGIKVAGRVLEWAKTGEIRGPSLQGPSKLVFDNRPDDLQRKYP